jgi:hypothetical protein
VRSYGACGLLLRKLVWEDEVPANRRTDTGADRPELGTGLRRLHLLSAVHGAQAVADSRPRQRYLTPRSLPVTSWSGGGSSPPARGWWRSSSSNAGRDESAVHSRSSVRPSPRLRPGWIEGRFGFFPELRTPPLPATHVRAGTGHRTLTRATSSTTPPTSYSTSHSHMRPRVAPSTRCPSFFAECELWQVPFFKPARASVRYDARIKPPTSVDPGAGDHTQVRLEPIHSWFKPLRRSPIESASGTEPSAPKYIGSV